MQLEEIFEARMLFLKEKKGLGRGELKNEGKEGMCGVREECKCTHSPLSGTVEGVTNKLAEV